MKTRVRIEIDVDDLGDHKDLADLLRRTAHHIKANGLDSMGLMHDGKMVGDLIVTRVEDERDRRKREQEEREIMKVIDALRFNQMLHLATEVLSLYIGDRPTTRNLRYRIFYAVQDGHLSIEDIKQFNESTKEML